MTQQDFEIWVKYFDIALTGTSSQQVQAPYQVVASASRIADAAVSAIIDKHKTVIAEK